LVDEVYEALELAKLIDDWDEVRDIDIIHEWHESAIALSSDELSEAFGKY
jgi:hypothetical protein